MSRTRSKYSNPDFQFVRFSLGGLDFGLDISSVREIIRYTALVSAECPPFAVGAVRVRSMLIPVIDLASRFSLSSPDAKTSMIIIVSIDSLIAGLMVDAVSDIALGAMDFTLRPEGQGRPWDKMVEARVEADSGPVLILSAAELLTPDEKAMLAAPSAPDGAGGAPISA